MVVGVGFVLLCFCIFFVYDVCWVKVCLGVVCVVFWGWVFWFLCVCVVLFGDLFLLWFCGFVVGEWWWWLLCFVFGWGGCMDFGWWWCCFWYVVFWWWYFFCFFVGVVGLFFWDVVIFFVVCWWFLYYVWGKFRGYWCVVCLRLVRVGGVWC